MPSQLLQPILAEFREAYRTIGNLEAKNEILRTSHEQRVEAAYVQGKAESESAGSGPSPAQWLIEVATLESTIMIALDGGSGIEIPKPDEAIGKIAAVLAVVGELDPRRARALAEWAAPMWTRGQIWRACRYHDRWLNDDEGHTPAVPGHITKAIENAPDLDDGAHGYGEAAYGDEADTVPDVGPSIPPAQLLMELRNGPGQAPILAKGITGGVVASWTDHERYMVQSWVRGGASAVDVPSPLIGKRVDHGR